MRETRNEAENRSNMFKIEGKVSCNTSQGEGNNLKNKLAELLVLFKN